MAGALLKYNGQALQTPSGAYGINNLVPENIKSGVNIGGVVGNYTGDGYSVDVQSQYFNYVLKRSGSGVTTGYRDAFTLNKKLKIKQIYKVDTSLATPTFEILEDGSYQTYVNTGATDTIYKQTTFSVSTEDGERYITITRTTMGVGFFGYAGNYTFIIELLDNTPLIYVNDRCGIDLGSYTKGSANQRIGFTTSAVSMTPTTLNGLWSAGGVAEADGKLLLLLGVKNVLKS